MIQVHQLVLAALGDCGCTAEAHTDEDGGSGMTQPSGMRLAIGVFSDTRNVSHSFLKPHNQPARELISTRKTSHTDTATKP